MVNTSQRRRSSEFAVGEVDLSDQLTAIHSDDEVEDRFKNLSMAMEKGKETEEDKRRAALEDQRIEAERKKVEDATKKQAEIEEKERNRKPPKKVKNKITGEMEYEVEEVITLTEEEAEILKIKRDQEAREEERKNRLEMDKKEIAEFQKLRIERLKAQKVRLTELRILSIHDVVTILPILYPITADAAIKKLAATLGLSAKDLYIVYMGKSFHGKEMIPEECLNAEKFNHLRWVNEKESNHFHKYMNIENLKIQLALEEKKKEEEKKAELAARRRSSVGAAGGANAMTAQDIRKAANMVSPVMSSESESSDEELSGKELEDESSDSYNVDEKPGTAGSNKQSWLAKMVGKNSEDQGGEKDKNKGKRTGKRKKKNKEIEEEDVEDSSGEDFDVSELGNELASLVRPPSTSSSGSSRPSTMSRRKKKRRPSSELRERGFLVSYELAQIKCEQYAPLLEKAGFNDMGSFAYITESELKGPPLWIPNRATRRILGLADVFKRQIELKGVSQTSSYLKRLKEKKGSYTVDGVNFFQTARELNEFIERKNAPKATTPPREKNVLKKHDGDVSIKISRIRKRIKEELALNSDEPPMALLLKYAKKRKEEEISRKLAAERNKPKKVDSTCRHNPSGNAFCCAEHSQLLERDNRAIVATDKIDFMTYFDLTLENANSSKSIYLPHTVYETVIHDVLAHFHYDCYPKLVHGILKEASTDEEYKYFDPVIIKNRVIDILVAQRSAKIQETGN